MTRPQTLIRSKTRVPAVADAVIDRARVIETLQRAAHGRRILQVVASAGSGKTTALVQFLAMRPGPHAWLSLGEADGSPGRFVTYLAAAIDAIASNASARVHDLLSRGAAPADCAALLAEDLPAGATVVIDDLHHVEDRPPVLTVLRALLDHVAPEALVVLASRRMVHLDLSRSELTGLSSTVSGRDLAFTASEVGELLAARGLPASSEVVAASSGGWAAGIVFEALRGRSGAPTPADDPFFAYLGAEVLDALPTDLRRDVVSSALLHTVDPRGLAALLEIPSGDALYGAIRRHQLPATLEPEGLRYHPRFREFLLSRLSEDPDEMRTLLVRHARRLAADGQAEEAADHLIAAGAPGEAAGAVEASATAVLLRGDWDKVLGWCEALGEEVLSARPSLRGCQLRATLTGRRADLPELVRGLRASGEYDRLVREDPDAATTAVFGLHLHGDWGSLLDLLPPDEASQGARAMRYVLQVGSGDHPPRPWRVHDVRRLTPHVGLLQCGLYFQGRFAEVEAFGALHSEDDDPALTALYRISSLRERGLLGDARAAFEDATPYIPATGFGDFWRHVEGELVFAEGDRDRGLRLVREAREGARALGHQPADRAIFAATEGKMLVRLGLVEEAVELLRTTLGWCQERGLPCFGEWAATWLAAALLRRGDPPAAAIALLEKAIAGMRRAERSLELPAAWVLLAEARWRAGDEAGHDAAADAAHTAAEATGSLGPLLLALDDMPDVSARRIDGGGPGAPRWAVLGRAGAPSRDRTSAARMLIGTLARPRILIDGAEREISPPRAVDVAASVARSGARGVPRAALVEELSEHSADAGNYLRQIIHRLRRLAPAGVSLSSDDGLLRWTPAGAVVTEDQMLLALLARARREVGADRLSSLGAALELAARGPLAPAGETAATHRLGAELDARVADARRDHADALLAAGRAGEALTAARAAVSAEPYREDGWRLLMRAAAASEGPPAVVPVFVECRRALTEIGLDPSQGTRDLLDRLRDPEVPEVTARR